MTSENDQSGDQEEPPTNKELLDELLTELQLKALSQATRNRLDADFILDGEYELQGALESTTEAQKNS